MVNLALRYRVAQRAHDVLLADDVSERARAVATVERRAGGHRTIESSRATGGHGWDGERALGATQLAEQTTR